MKESTIMRCISFDLLRFIRDTEPTESELVSWLGEDDFRYSVLRNAELLVVETGIVRISPKHLTPDGKGVWWWNTLYHIDKGTVDVF